MPRSRRARAIVISALAAWGALAGAGILFLHAYELAPGRPPAPVLAWPAGSRIGRDPASANLVMAAHPQCPCTRASFDALERIMERSRGRVTAHVLFYRPRSATAAWGSPELRRRAAAIPGVRAHDDPDGDEAARFGAETSGTVLLYDRDGRRTFAGGVTAARGQAGANPGLDAVIARLTGPQSGPGVPCSPVFGCPLREVARDGEGR